MDLSPQQGQADGDDSASESQPRLESSTADCHPPAKTSPPPEAMLATATKKSTAVSEPTAHRAVAPRQPPDSDPEHDRAQSTLSHDHAASDSDEADFEDAPTVPLPESADATPSPSPTPSPTSSPSASLPTASPTASSSPPSSRSRSLHADPATPAVKSAPRSSAATSLSSVGAAVLETSAGPKPQPLAATSPSPGNANSSRAQPAPSAAPLSSSPSKAAATRFNPAAHGHSRESSLTGAVNALGLSHVSHQTLPPPQEKEEDDGGWQSMPSYARYDMYDDNDRLIAREHEEEDGEKNAYAGLGGAGKGYTRVLMDEDAQSATSMDENTQYLFKEANGTSMMGEGEEARDAVAQMQATKDLLTEGQRIAYVGLVRLEISRSVKEAEELEITKKAKKEVTTAAEATKMWGQKMMMRLYSHMDISEAEQVMIEQLAEHGVVPADLTPALLANARVQNPMAEDGKKSETGSTSSKSDTSLDEKAADPPPPYEGTQPGLVPGVRMPAQLPTTEKIDIDLRWTVLCDLFLLLIADSVYDARSRVLLERVGASLDISWIDICRFEKRVTDALEMQQAAEKENWNEEQHMESRRKMAQTRRYVMMGLATVGGGLVIGLSAGLLAPVIGAGLAAGFTTIGVTGTSSFLAGAGGAAIITSSAAASGSVIGGRAANRRTGAVKTFEYRPLHNNKRVNLIVTLSGWLTGKMDDIRLPFSTVDPIMGDIYSVLWEPEMLRSMGDTINILATEALTQGLQQILGSTILVSLMAALQLPIVLTKLSYLIDNPWAVSLDRAVAAGLILADSLLERSLGTRPIILVGYSLGARVIFSCLQELAKKGAYGLVQDVYMFGSPIVVKKDEYLRARTVVSGRFVNGYNRNDWILGYLFRLTNGGIRRIAGLAAVEGCPWIENMDVSDLVAGHMEYRAAMPSLLMRCGWSVESEEFSEIEDPDPENHKERQRELINEIEEARKELEKDGKAKKAAKFGLFGRRKKTERQEWELYEDSTAADKTAGGKTEDEEGNNHGVLFDIDAIRAELAKEVAHGTPDEALRVREIESTLPPMKLDLSPAAGPARITDGPERRRRPSAHLEPCPGNRGAGLPSPRPWAAANPASSSGWGDPDDEDFGKETEISMTFA